MKYTLNRTKKNDIVLESNNLISVQNILFIISALMVLLCLFRFVKVDMSFFGSDYKAVPYLSPFNMGHIGSGILAMAGSYGAFLGFLKIFSFLYLIPIITIILFFVNRVIKSIKHSYRLVMVQYIILILGCTVNFISLSIMKVIARMSSSNGIYDLGIKTTIACFIYGLLNIILFIIAFYAGINTGIMKIHENIDAQDIFSKEAIQKTSELAKNIGTNLNTAVKAANNAINEAKKDNKEKTVKEDLSDTVPKEETTASATKDINSSNEVKDEGLKCPSCGAENKPDKKFCTSCGTALTK